MADVRPQAAQPAQVDELAHLLGVGVVLQQRRAHSLGVSVEVAIDVSHLLTLDNLTDKRTCAHGTSPAA